MTRPTLIVATNNKHKIKEITQILKGRMDVQGPESLAPGLTWEETADSFVGNARIKADALAAALTGPAAILADDSGLEVEALGGAPGVYSSRYAGEDGNDQANNEKLLAALTNVPPDQRRAKFVCVLVYRTAEGKEHVFRGECPGKITDQPHGAGGFGYDPLFVPDGKDQPMAALSADEKNAISHRGHAMAQWMAFLDKQP